MRPILDGSSGTGTRVVLRLAQYAHLPPVSPVRLTIVLIVAIVLQGLAVHAAAGAPDLARLPVDRVQTVAFSEFWDGVELAARGASPLEIALAVARPFEGLSQEIIQENDRNENPTSSRVVVLRDGLLDDAIRSERWEIGLERTAAGAWAIHSVNRAWRCRRGHLRDAFGVALCR
jgi:hypothetical protein